MTRKFPIYILLAVVLTAVMAGCNSDDSNIVIEGDYSNASVTSFNLKANTKILANLDSVFFSINLNTGEIFNADSLPVGTKINRMLISVGTPVVSGCEITFRPAGASADTTVNYLTNPTDSIDFSAGPARLKITSYNGTVSREYTIKVNVHNVEPDSLTWGKVAYNRLPSLLGSVKAQHTVEYDGGAMCLTTDGNDACAAVIKVGETSWTLKRVTLPARVDVASLRAVETTLYIIDDQGNLYESGDRAESWDPTGCVMNHLYGAYNGMLLGARHDSDGWKQVTWPAGDVKPLPDGCPVGGTSQMISYTTEWSTVPMSVLVGGVDASGQLTGAAWAYDGNIWACISQKEIPSARDMTLVPYFAYRTNKTNWTVTRRTVLLAMGGREPSGEPRRSLYVSYDRGLNWNRSDTLLCMPPYIPAFYEAQAVVMPTTMTQSSVDSDGEWIASPVMRLPAWYRLAETVVAESRAAEAVTEWECPYIYLFGGITSHGTTSDTVWRGVLNRLTFCPLY